MLFERSTKQKPQAGLYCGITAAACAQDGRLAAFSDSEQVIELWDIVSGKAISSWGGFSERITCLGFSGDSKLLVSGHADGTLLVWNLELCRSLPK
jgi:WD40 repeat protein